MKRVYLGPARTPPARKVLRAGFLGLLTLGIVTAPFQSPNTSPAANDRVLTQSSPAPEVSTSASSALALPSQPPPTPATEDATITMPDLRGQDAASARRHLRTLGVRIIGVESVTGKQVVMESLWTVVGQSPEPGAAVTPDTPITLKLDKVQEPEPTKAVEPRESPTEEPRETESATSRPSPKKTTQPPAPAEDPRFDTCGEANAHGYGNYQKGVDPEYGWYEDRDGDGMVCER
ncbi:PASTA domain-containing protein [Nonomuraea sp. CA-141351]|uniref:PASTA domain-containing protein n=1 Tax=Nonomuraea sp. CA-141351 TaxID=3239996 RepID=UPI003D8FF6DC